MLRCRASSERHKSRPNSRDKLKSSSSRVPAESSARNSAASNCKRQPSQACHKATAAHGSDHSADGDASAIKANSPQLGQHSQRLEASTAALSRA